MSNPIFCRILFLCVPAGVVLTSQIIAVCCSAKFSIAKSAFHIGYFSVLYNVLGWIFLYGFFPVNLFRPDAVNVLPYLFLSFFHLSFSFSSFLFFFFSFSSFSFSFFFSSSSLFAITFSFRLQNPTTIFILFSPSPVRTSLWAGTSSRRGTPSPTTTTTTTTRRSRSARTRPRSSRWDEHTQHNTAPFIPMMNGCEIILKEYTNVFFLNIGVAYCLLYCLFHF